MLAQECDQGAIRTPYDIFDWRGRNFRKLLLLLDVVEHNRGCRAEDEAGSAAVEDLVGLDRRLDRLDDRVLQVAHLDQLETVSRTNTSAR